MNQAKLYLITEGKKTIFPLRKFKILNFENRLAPHFLLFYFILHFPSAFSANNKKSL
ncbi:hypothetical protein NC653_015605 [Populus alba x Populus x berolinensis]|uniref:Uncharacterized protein n=1 Tax=Populus alba x Populus x berolinensis TaxID=444605 RepID=A0AAD6QL26_9ROSI|nr:hypothetical protein NC653_015605 [Populus alba x Populus x berolinensis]